jgi:hypothetical protein
MQVVLGSTERIIRGAVGINIDFLRISAGPILTISPGEEAAPAEIGSGDVAHEIKKSVFPPVISISVERQLTVRGCR